MKLLAIATVAVLTVAVSGLVAGEVAYAMTLLFAAAIGALLLARGARERTDD